MAQTIYAGGGGWNIGLQGASDTLAGAQRLENDQKLTDAQVRRMEAMGEAEELENQIRQQTIEQMRDASRVESFLMRKSLQPDEFAEQAEEAPESIAQAMGGATPQQVQQMRGLLETGQRIAAQTQFARELGEDLGMAGMLAASDSEASPMLAEGIADLQQRIADYDPMNPEAESPQEIAAQYRALKQQDLVYRQRKDEQRILGQAFDTRYGTDPRLAPFRAMYLDPDTRDDAKEMILEIEDPELARQIRGKAVDQAVSKERARLEDLLMQKVLDDEIDPSTPEGQELMDKFWRDARAVKGERVVPLSEQEQAEAATFQMFDAYTRAGFDLEKDEDARAAAEALIPPEVLEAERATTPEQTPGQGPFEGGMRPRGRPGSKEHAEGKRQMKAAEEAGRKAREKNERRDPGTTRVR